jgi:hypothetical protein
MDYTKLIDAEHNDEPKTLAVIAPLLKFNNAPANTLQMQIEQDGQEAYINLWLTEAILLRDKLSEWISDKEAYNQTRG